jgi:hypothetical protein
MTIKAVFGDKGKFVHPAFWRAICMAEAVDMGTKISPKTVVKPQKIALGGDSFLKH